MFKASNPQKEELDRAGKLVLRSAGANEEDVAAAASSPYFFTRIRAAIAEEQRRGDEAGGWLSMILVARRAVPAMALVATLAALLTFWSVRPGMAPAPISGDEEALFGVLEPGVEQTVLASRNGLTRDEIFNIVVERNYEVRGK
ncbi:MAG: hypothetical protein ACXW18_08460 [Pyrinomonadaceae bacterium]